MGSPTARALELLRLTHASPGLTRSRAATLLGVTSGTITELVGSLVGARLLDERPVATGGRGRPTRELLAHAEGPLVLSGLVTHESWRIRAEELGGAPVAVRAGAHDDSSDRLIEDLGGAVADLIEEYGDRVRGLGVALPGVVRDNLLVHAPLLGWHDVDLRRAWPAPRKVFVAGNDATLAGLGEARRGAAAGAGLHLHLLIDAGLGGAVTLDGEVLNGTHGLVGEFGHMPFGDPAVECLCGARGCWTTSVGADALARELGEKLPPDAVTYARHVLDRTDPDARRAVAVVAAGLGSGIAGLVNGLDAGLVTIGGLAPRVVETAPEEFAAAYRAGLMAFRRAAPPPIVHAALGDEAPLTGAAEQVWSRLWATL